MDNSIIYVIKIPILSVTFRNIKKDTSLKDIFISVHSDHWNFPRELTIKC